MTELEVDEQVPVVTPTRLPVLPLKETVVFPESMTPLAVGQERSIKLIDDVVAGERVLALLTVKDTETEQPGWKDVYEVGTVAVAAATSTSSVSCNARVKAPYSISICW